MEKGKTTPSDTRSIKSSGSGQKVPKVTIKSPGIKTKKPLRLHIPNTPGNFSGSAGFPPGTAYTAAATANPYTANVTLTPGAMTAGVDPFYNPRKASQFMFHQFSGIRDFAKSGLSIGEKSTLWLYNKLSSWSKRWFTHMFLTVVLFIYTVGGALLFIYIEGRNESSTLTNLRNERKKLIYDLKKLCDMPDILSEGEWLGESIRRIEEFQQYVIEDYVNNPLTVKNNEKVWTLLDSIVYCATIYTSIGYGHITPQTTTGRALTIVYAIIGIPLFLIALTDFGKLFTRGIKFVWSFVRRIYYTGNCRRARKTAHMKEIFKGAQMMYEIATLRRPSVFGPTTTEDPENPSQTANTDTPTTPALSNFEIDDEFNLPISVAIFILVVYIFLGAIIYWVWEGWDFFAAFYFVFISMSTVGFGDFVPRNDICMIFSIVYLCFGLALMSMCFNVVQVKLSDTFKQASSKLGATIGIEVVDEDGSITTVPPVTVEMPDIHDTKINENGNAKKDNEIKEELQNGDITDLQKIKKNVSGSLNDFQATEVEDLTKEGAKKK